MYKNWAEMAESIQTVLQELQGMLNLAGLTKGFATAGLAEIQRIVASTPRFPTNPDPTVHIGTGDPNDARSKPYAYVKSSELPALVARGGSIEIQLGRQWAVSVFTEWENTFRPRLAAAHGCKPNDIQAYVFGDLRRIRHDLLHNRAIASKTNAGQCDVLQWFAAGDEIVITSEHIAEFMGQIPWDELEGDPPRVARVGRSS